MNGDNRLRITPGKYNISTAITKDYKFNTKQNLIIVEFDYYAYGGCWYGGLGEYGADGIVNVLFESSCWKTLPRTREGIWLVPNWA